MEILRGVIQQLLALPKNKKTEELMNWKGIVVHHSATPDSKITRNADTIKYYWTHWRYNYENISEEKALELKAQGKVVDRPYSDTPYHKLIEQVNGVWTIVEGRPLSSAGAHAGSRNYNLNYIGICVIGNFDVVDVPKEAWELLKKLIKELRQACKDMKVEDIIGHREIPGVTKSCPGKKFDMAKLRNELK
jgi:hypothetical protein